MDYAFRHEEEIRRHYERELDKMRVKLARFETGSSIKDSLQNGEKTTVGAVGGKPPIPSSGAYDPDKDVDTKDERWQYSKGKSKPFNCAPETGSGGWPGPGPGDPDGGPPGGNGDMYDLRYPGRLRHEYNIHHTSAGQKFRMDDFTGQEPEKALEYMSQFKIVLRNTKPALTNRQAVDLFVFHLKSYALNWYSSAEESVKTDITELVRAFNRQYLLNGTISHIKSLMRGCRFELGQSVDSHVSKIVQYGLRLSYSEAEIIHELLESMPKGPIKAYMSLARPLTISEFADTLKVYIDSIDYKHNKKPDTVNFVQNNGQRRDSNGRSKSIYKAEQQT